MTITFPIEWNPSDTQPYVGGVASGVTLTLTSDSFAGSSTTRVQENVRAGTHSTKLTVASQVGDNGNQQMGWDPVTLADDYAFNIIGSDVYYHCVLTIMPGFDWGPYTAKTKSGRVSGPEPGLVQGSTRYFRKTGIGVAECGGAAGGLGPAAPPNYAVLNDDSNVFINFDMDDYADGLPHEFIVRVKGNTTAGAASPTSADSHDAILQVWIDNVLIGTLTGWRLNNNASQVMVEQWWGDMVYTYFQLGGSEAGYGGVIYASEHFTNDSKSSLHDLSPPTNLVIT